jgi:hypothetical protein
MFKRSLVCLIVVLLVSATSFAAVGQFDTSANIGYETAGFSPGWTTYDPGTGAYNVTGGGGDIWDNYDQFTYAYKSVTGSIRMTANYQWLDKGQFTNDWAKAGTMMRYTTDPRSQHITAAMHLNPDWLGVQLRSNYDGGSGGYGDVGGVIPQPVGLGVERVQYGVLNVITPLYNTGSGWQSFGSTVVTGMPDTVLFGAAVGSHANWRWSMSTAKVTDVTFGEPIVPKVGPAVCDPPPSRGFLIRTLKWDDFYGAPPYWSWDVGSDAMDEALDTGMVAGIACIEEGTRLDPYVNLYDSGGRGNFTGATEISYPGIDIDEINPGEPANGDDDDNTATEILACIHLTAGYHIIGINSDDGGILKIGGVEVGRTGEWKGTSDVDFLFSVDTEGNYPLQVRHLEGGGGASIELSYVLKDGSRILLGAAGGPEVYAVPEPATIALLSLGGLLLGIRRKR